MCLDIITKRNPWKSWGVGYKKYIEHCNGRLDSAVMTCEEYWDYGRWYSADETDLYTTYEGEKYTSGFHIFSTKAEAKSWGSPHSVVVKVRYRGAHTIGIQNGAKVIVARKVKLLKEIRDGRYLEWGPY